MVHMALTIDAYQGDPVRLAGELDIPMPVLFEILATLERAGFVGRDGHRWTPLRTSIHLPRTAPSFRRWSASVRHVCADRVARRAAPDDFLVSVTFSATEKERGALRDALLGVLRDTEARVDAAPEEGFTNSTSISSPGSREAEDGLPKADHRRGRTVGRSSEHDPVRLLNHSSTRSPLLIQTFLSPRDSRKAPPSNVTFITTTPFDKRFVNARATRMLGPTYPARRLRNSSS